MSNKYTLILMERIVRNFIEALSQAKTKSQLDRNLNQIINKPITLYYKGRLIFIGMLFKVNIDSVGGVPLEPPKLPQTEQIAIH